MPPGWTIDDLPPSYQRQALAKLAPRQPTLEGVAVPELTERQWQTKVVEAARALGWWSYHTHNSQRSDPGFPDLVLVRERVVYAELKREKGRTTKTQDQVLDLLRHAGQEVHVWRPSDWPAVLAALAPKD